MDRRNIPPHCLRFLSLSTRTLPVIFTVFASPETFMPVAFCPTTFRSFCRQRHAVIVAIKIYPRSRNRQPCILPASETFPLLVVMLNPVASLLTLTSPVLDTVAPLTVDEHANRSSIGNNNISFVVNRAVVTNVLNTMRTACNSQATIQIYNADIARDFGTRGIFFHQQWFFHCYSRWRRYR